MSYEFPNQFELVFYANATVSTNLLPRKRQASLGSTAGFDGLFVPVKLRLQSNAPNPQLRYCPRLVTNFCGNTSKYCLPVGESEDRVSTRGRGLLFFGVDWGQKESS